jgi:hypothetical protein
MVIVAWAVFNLVVHFYWPLLGLTLAPAAAAG